MNKIRMKELKGKLQIYSTDKSIIGIAPVGENVEALLAQLDFKGKYLPHIRKISEYRQCEWLSVRVLLKELLKEEKEILYYPSGKPYLADCSYKISISHTKGYATLILDPDKEVAIDIEKISPRIEKISTKFMNEKETIALSQENKLIHLLLHWSAKESMFKILAEENIEFKTQLHIHPFEPVLNTWSYFKASETRSAKQNVFDVNYIVTGDYVLTYILNHCSSFSGQQRL